MSALPLSESVRAEIRSCLVTLFEDGVAVGVADPAVFHPPLPDAEARAVAQAVEVRRREFTAGRAAARTALAALGHAAATVPQGADRAPIWPPGVAGSIAHCREVALAAVTPATRRAALGVDVEPDRPLPGELWAPLFSSAERARLDAAPSPEGAALRLFCAKEAAYKAHYAGARRLLEPRDICVRPTRDGHFVATFPCGEMIAVRIGVAAGFVLAAATVRRARRKRFVSGRDKAISWQLWGKGDR